MVEPIICVHIHTCTCVDTVLCYMSIMGPVSMYIMLCNTNHSQVLVSRCKAWPSRLHALSILNCAADSRSLNVPNLTEVGSKSMGTHQLNCVMAVKEAHWEDTCVCKCVCRSV